MAAKLDRRIYTVWYRVNGKWPTFTTFEEAQVFASAIFKATGCVVEISW